MNDCPACGQPLVIYEIGVIEADICADCRGTWLDSGELELIASHCGLSDEQLRLELSGNPPVRRDSRRCPRCRSRMDITRHGGGIELDRCPKGHGFWLDSGEMHGLLASYAGLEESPEIIRRLGELLQFEGASTTREGKNS